MTNSSERAQDPQSGTPRSHYAILALILLLAVVVRFWGISFGLPNPYCRPDEEIIVGKALDFYRTGDLNPHWFSYPSLMMYLVYLAYLAYGAGGALFGMYESLAGFFASYDYDPTVFYLIPRAISAVLGTATVAVVYAIGRRCHGSRAGMFAAFFLAITYLHVRESHFGVTDTAMVFFITLSVLFLIRACDRPSIGNYLAAGLFAGLATSTKYAGVFLVVPMAVAHAWYVARDGWKRPWRLVADKRIASFIGGLGSAALAGTPYALFDYRTFFDYTIMEMAFQSEGYLLISDRGWKYHLLFSLPHGLGVALLVASAAGCLVLLKRDVRKGLVLLAFPAVYYLVAGRSLIVFARYILPVAPFLCIGAGVAVKAAADALTRPRVRAAAVAGLLALLPAQSLYNVIRCNRLLATKDNRVVASEWLVERLPPGSTIYQTGNRWAMVQLPRTVDSLERIRALIRDPKKQDDLDRELAVQRQRGGAAFEHRSYNLERDEFNFMGIPTGDSPDFVIVDRSALKRFDRIDRVLPDLEHRLDRDYVLVKEFIACDPDEPRNRYDQTDAFYLPYAGFHDVTRPGPNLYVYAKKDGVT